MAFKPLTMDQLLAKVENEPTTTRTRSITLERISNLDALLADDNMAGFTIDEAKPDGTPYSLQSLVSAYTTLIKSRKLQDKVTVRKLPVAGEVQVEKIVPAK